MIIIIIIIIIIGRYLFILKILIRETQTGNYKYFRVVSIRELKKLILFSKCYQVGILVSDSRRYKTIDESMIRATSSVFN
jgi:hypothetical protein